VALLALALAPPPAAATLVDAVLAEAAGQTVTASDVALARALGVFGLTPSAAPIGVEDVERVAAARLEIAEAERLGIGPTDAERESAWAETAARLGGAGALAAWLEQAAVEPAWARRLVEQDLARRRFVDLRFGAFVFITEAEVTAALGPGEHAPDERERQRETLREAETARRRAEWLAEARTQVPVRVRLGPGETVPSPLPMPKSAVDSPP
jgi:hypothetical protein